MSDISIEKTREDAASTSLQVTVPADRVKAAEDKAVRYYARRARLPGFRPGKAPEQVIRKRFGEAIRQNVLEELVRESWETARTSHDLKPVAQPHIHNLKFDEGGPVEFELHVEVQPRIALERVGGFKLAREVKPVSDEQVAEQLRQLQEQKARWTPVSGQKPAPGQMVQIEVATATDGAGSEFGEPRPYTVVLGSGQTLPEIEEKIMQLVPGRVGRDRRQAARPPRPIAAQPAEARKVRIHLLEVKNQELPALDDDLAREVGDFENLDALKAAVREDLDAESEREADNRMRSELLEQIAAANNITAPPSLVERTIRGYAQAYGIPDEQLERFAGEFQPVAESQVRRDMILNAVLEKEKLAATEEEIDERVARMAAARGVETGPLYASLQKNNRLAELERSIAEEKAFNFLLSQSTIAEGSA